MQRVSITVDVEQDCPPLLESMRGVEEGLPRLLELFKEERIRATFFATGVVAECYPESIEMIVEQGHELGCHGYAHERYDHLSLLQAEKAIGRATEILRRFDDNLVSFRAPNLKFPARFLRLLEAEGYLADSSIARYKPPFSRGIVIVGKIVRVPASVTSSLLRLPLRLVLPLLFSIKDPVLFVHPWEFVDMRGERVRFDCKFNTGSGALRNLRQLIRHFKSRGYMFVTIGDMAGLRPEGDYRHR
jgi:peptidoglycan/xylan/chitin deacetylase (PgdA/CDA1 family)